MRVVHVHLHRGRAADSARPSLPALYEDLARRMVLALEEMAGRRGRTGDDLEGHQFHGNQYVKVASGPKPTKVQAKNVKDAVYELLTSGHAFSKEEFLEIVGPDLKPKKLVDYLAMLKNPKYAGAKGALSIAKNADGHFYVALEDGQPAPALPKEPEVSPDLLKALAPHPHEKAVQGLAAPDGIKEGNDLTDVMNAFSAPPAPAPAPVAPAPAKPAFTGHEALVAAHPGSMPKAEADKHYDEAMKAAYESMAASVKKGYSAQIAAGAWKKSKASAMAAWATAVHGHAYDPKPQTVYKADEHLASVAGMGSPMMAAMIAWKHNTAQEKAGNFPPKPAAAPAAPVSTTAMHHAPVADMGHPAPVAPVDYHALMPSSFAPIGSADITGGKFGKGIASFKNDLIASSAAGNAVVNKKTIEQDLRERLKDRPNFKALSKRLGLVKEGPGSLESRLIQAWAASSGDHHDVSVALQLAVRDAFGIPDGHIEKKALASLQAHAHDEAKVISAGIHSLNTNMTPLAAHEVPTAKAALMEFVHAQYDATQELLKKQGHDHVFLARGMKVSASHDPKDGPAALRLQPASSFSTSYATAKAFAGGGGTVFVTKVPRQQVLSTYVTGFGCTSEHEVVVLAHEKMKAYAVHASLASGHTQAQEHLAAQIGKAGAKPAPGSLEAHTAAVLAKMKPSPHAQPFDLAAAKKAVVNAKSKAYKALKAAQAVPHPAKIAHAEKAAKEAQQAVAALNAMKGNK